MASSFYIGISSPKEHANRAWTRPNTSAQRLDLPDPSMVLRVGDGGRLALLLMDDGCCPLIQRMLLGMSLPQNFSAAFFLGILIDDNLLGHVPIP